MTFDDIIQGKPAKIVSMMHILREISMTIHPDISEDCYGGKVVQMALYSIGRKNNPTHGISASKDHCKVFLHHFDKVDVSDYNMEGKGKHARHFKIHSLDEVDQNKLLITLKCIATLAKSLTRNK